MSTKKNIFERLLLGENISFSDPDYIEIMKACNRTRRILIQINNEPDIHKVKTLLNEIFTVSPDESSTIFTPFHTNYGGNIHIGKNVFINHGCSFLDLGGITIEDCVMIAPKVNIITEQHPVEPHLRTHISGKPVHIKRNVWIGTNATILPGVTIGSNSVIGAGAVVTKDVPDNVIVAGIPAKIIREINPQ